MKIQADKLSMGKILDLLFILKKIDGRKNNLVKIQLNNNFTNLLMNETNKQKQIFKCFFITKKV